MTELEFLIQLHNRLTAVADLFLHYYDPCRMDGQACKAGAPNPCCKHTRFDRPDLEHCPFLGPAGCEMPNLKCKLWLCATALEGADPKMVESLQALEVIMRLYHFGGKPYLGHPYTGADRPQGRAD